MTGWWTRALTAANAGAVVALALAVAPALLPPRGLPARRLPPDLGDPVLPRLDVSLEPALLAPIFNPGRVAAATGSAAPLQPPPAVIGVVAQASGAGLALVRAEGKQQVVRVGAEVGGWRLLSVARRQATFARGGERHDVRIFAEPAATPGAPAPLPAGAMPAPSNP